MLLILLLFLHQQVGDPAGSHDGADEDSGERGHQRYHPGEGSLYCVSALLGTEQETEDRVPL